jgi:hypothetical protein
MLAILFECAIFDFLSKYGCQAGNMAIRQTSVKPIKALPKNGYSGEGESKPQGIPRRF